MVLEVAELRVAVGTQSQFEEALRRGVASVLRKAAGARRIVVRRGVENPERYLLTIEWDTLEDHTVGFRSSPLFAEWRSIVGPFFVEPPRVEHFEERLRTDA